VSNQPEKNPIEGEVIEAEVSDLKDLVFVVKGQIVESNLSEIAQQISANIDAIPEELETEGDFNNAEKVAKQLREAKDQLAERRDKALQDAEELYAELQLIGEVEDKCVTKAKSLEKLVRNEKTRKRENMVDKSYASCEHHYDAYVDDCNDFRLARPAIPLFNIEQYPQIIKGCSSFTSMQARLDKQAESIKAQIDTAFNSVITNAKAIDATELPALFQDRKSLLLMDAEHLGSEIRARVATHEAAEAKKQAEQDRLDAEKLAAETLELEETDLDHNELTTDDEPPFEPDTPEINAKNQIVDSDNTPPFGFANGSPVPIVKSAPEPETVSAGVYEMTITITGELKRAQEITKIAHGRLKNMPEVSHVGLRDTAKPSKQIKLILETLRNNNEHRAVNQINHILEQK